MSAVSATGSGATAGASPLQDRRSSLVGDVVAVFLREMFLVLRDPFSLIFSLVQPLVFLALFAVTGSSNKTLIVFEPKGDPPPAGILFPMAARRVGPKMSAITVSVATLLVAALMELVTMTR